MSLDPQTILSAAKLAKLNIDKACADEYANSIGKILTMMAVLDQVDTSTLKPLANIHEACADLRTDNPDTHIDKDANQAIAPAVQDGLYLVPQVIE